MKNNFLSFVKKESLHILRDIHWLTSMGLLIDVAGPQSS